MFWNINNKVGFIIKPDNTNSLTLFNFCKRTVTSHPIKRTLSKRAIKRLFNKQISNNKLIFSNISKIPSCDLIKLSLYQRKGFSTIKNTEVFDSEKITFILSEWSNDFPNQTNLNYEQIGKLASQSNKIGLWLTEAKQKYSNFKDKPDWFESIGDDSLDWSAELREKLNQAKLINNQLSQTKNQISLEAKRSMADANKTHEQQLIKLFSSSPELLIHTFNIQVLPLETHFDSMTFSEPELASKFLKTELIKFQKSCLKKYTDGILTTDDLINIIKTKR
jgi:hypothetical protein